MVNPTLNVMLAPNAKHIDQAKPNRIGFPRAQDRDRADATT